MNKAQVVSLNVVGGLCALLILGNLVLNPLNNRLNQTLLQTQNELNKAQQLHNTFQNLAVRIAQSAQKETALRDLMVKHQLKVNLNVDGQIKQVP